MVESKVKGKGEEGEGEKIGTLRRKGEEGGGRERMMEERREG